MTYEEHSVEGAAERGGQLLADGNILAWFQGGAEFGPRALGHRSILADPRGEHIKDTLNMRVKFRESFRPFAPAVLQGDASTYFDMPEPHSPYMLLVCPVREPYRSIFPGVTHVDGTARVQTVNRDTSPTFARLIESFRDATGIPIVLNTSFNLKGEPIVETPSDAVRCFVSTEIDWMVLGRYVIRAPDITVKVPARTALHLSLEAVLPGDEPNMVPSSLKIRNLDTGKESAWEPDVLEVLKAMDGRRTVRDIADMLAVEADALKPRLLALYRQGYFSWKTDR